MSKPTALFLMGPTGTGKTDLAIAIAQCVPAHIISVDSALVYRGMDIGTAKPSQDVLQRFPPALVDICDPAEPYSVARFTADAREELDKAIRDSRLPLFVGGSMLYFKAMREGLSDLPAADPEIRSELDQLAIKQGWPALHAKLAEVDPATAARLHPNHSVRIQRALEVWMQTGIALSEWHRRGSSGSFLDLLDPIQVALVPAQRQLLHERLEQRLDVMLQAGLVEEVRHLFERTDISKGLPSMRSVGYRQVWEFLEGKLDASGMRENILSATRQLAKRQITWLNSWQDLQLFDPLDDAGQWRSTQELAQFCLKFL